MKTNEVAGRTIEECATEWGVSYSQVRKWLKQGRLSGAQFKGRIWLITTEERPDKVGYGGLTEDQRKAWPRKDGVPAPKPAKKKAAKRARA